MSEENNYYSRAYVKINCYYNLSSDRYQTSHQQAQSSAITTGVDVSWVA